MIKSQFQPNCKWLHGTNRVVTLESTHLLLLHEFERVALQKLALQKLNKTDLGITIRLPKGREKNEYNAHSMVCSIRYVFKAVDYVLRMKFHPYVIKFAFHQRGKSLAFPFSFSSM